MDNWKIVSTASYVPPLVKTNDQLSELMDTSDEWIKTRTGISNRHISLKENTSDLAVKVGQRLLKQTNWEPESVDLVIVATMSPDSYTPSTAAIVQGKLGMTKALAFDISAACSGFIYALSVANGLLASTNKLRAIVIGSEVLSKIIDWHDRTTAVLFGDGAGGVAIEKSSERHLMGMELATFGNLGNKLVAGQTTVGSSFPKSVTSITPFRMNGREVYRFATHEVPRSIQEALDSAQVTAEQVDLFLLHQANARIIAQVAKRLNQPLTKFPINIDRYGNTSAASEPILLDECVRSGQIHRGSLVVLAGFGGGLTTGAMVIKY
ncbi:beta-ketoacyl-ACP synthase III [Limosilactobacillus fastidiosus]|uniref:Beta-ketoacyl-[acyl-carrier-protein] synthase III n=1 Tax=Limosilactobacillus fastidiosus TaxID=2759855 RepID=A0A7W3TYG4_9LACO|nr:beta-ketoacyl-ACP synthase III [Limosilactobacillus fastidiosus]MBB1062512.1 ketoacyl-ACP synthase III [Limosilactobacillus fastidiosus]MBB1085537.1 ketoacyl-ACP synthase III [Limosilactobacillus fastidiosus]MCD7083586.1 ketoacyl-ACP synthase III [Limosilactobacillus fastidiosus]MCD7085990.1 ketoacyl-ACP synthase III [Limosilactobacillus fastidiosus]MCD7114366.1 ketoacyl-ACP synthase III [Limosilactobacillus fastidiosus]